MMGKTEIQHIMDYTLENEDNLETGLVIASTSDEIRKRVMANLLETLENAMKGSLDDEWIIISDPTKDVFPRYRGDFILLRINGKTIAILESNLKIPERGDS